MVTHEEENKEFQAFYKIPYVKFILHMKFYYIQNTKLHIDLYSNYYIQICKFLYKYLYYYYY